MKKFSIPLIILVVMLTACGTPAAKPEDLSDDAKIATQMANVLYNLQDIQKYYDDGLVAMASVGAGGTTLAWNGGVGKYTALLARSVGPTDNVLASTELMMCYPLWNALPDLPGQQGSQNIPAGFLEPLPPDGSISAPAGACPAGAKPGVTFMTAGDQGGKPVTPQLLAEKNLQTIPAEMLVVSQNDPGSLFSTINNMVPMGDRSLASPQGWNNLLWDKLANLQTPSQSLMDYQLWNASPELEQQIVDQYRQRLESYGVPDMVIEAFDNSDKTGWYANTQPTPEDALARMDILAEMTGSVSGTVHEQRDFSLPGAGQKPVFGTQTGDGTVTYDHPTLGSMAFEVDILLDKFDEQGRAVSGTVVAEDTGNGYTVRFVFQPDGTKEGEVLKDGELVGLLTMTIDADRFENYVDVQTNKSQPLPAPY